MARRTFRLLKITPELRKGAILEQSHGSYHAGYNAITGTKNHAQSEVYYSKQTVENQPSWFEEVEVCYKPKGK